LFPSIASQARAHAPVFRVGAAVVPINPSYPVYMGGYGGGPAGGTIGRHIDPSTGQPEDITARAVAIESPTGHVVELASVDSQGWFAGYEEGPYGISDVRAAAASWLRTHGAPTATPPDIIVSSLHEHAVPTIYGLFGPSDYQLPYLKEVAVGTTRALELAYAHARPARITWGTADAPWLAATTISQGNALEGWPRDGTLVALWARDASTGETIATYVQESGYPNIVYGPGDLLGPGGRQDAVLSTDFPSYAEHWIERRLGGVAILASGSLGNNTGPIQTDNAPSPDLPRVGHDRQTRAFDDIINMGSALGELTMEALAAGHQLDDPTVGSAEQYIVAPATGVAGVGLQETYNIRPIYDATFGQIFPGIYPTDRSQLPPYAVGPALGTWVTAVRIGRLIFLSEPGEYFASIHAAWRRAVHGAADVFVIGAAQDFLGYVYPAYVFPFTFEGGDEHVFNPSLTLGDQTVLAGEQDARALGFGADLTTTAELSVLDNDYARALQAGVQVMAFPHAGDIDPATGRFDALLEGLSTPERASAQGVCLAELFVSACPGVPSMGPFSFKFGDGSSLIAPPEAYARAWFSPFVHHAYRSPGSYAVSVSARSSDGSAGAMTLPVTVYPALRVKIVPAGPGELAARVSGGTGATLFVRWSLPDGRAAYGPRTARPASHGRLGVTVVDGTGTMATATL